MALKDSCSTALTNLAGLLTEATTGLEYVYTEPPDQINAPCLVMRDQGLSEGRAGGWRIVEWELEFSVYVSLRPDTPTAYDTARDIRADLVDRLGDDITLGGAIHNSYWKQPPRVTALRWGGEEGTLHAGVIGVLTLVIKEARSFA